jgi:RNA recognition motif-containing protein
MHKDMNIFVGNLPQATSAVELRETFGEFGPVSATAVIMDKSTGVSRGFGFVEMQEEEAKAAIGRLNGTEVGGQALIVRAAKTRESVIQRAYKLTANRA